MGDGCHGCHDLSSLPIFDGYFSNVILASGSPRRAELLKIIFKEFRIVPSLFKEDLDKASYIGNPKEYVKDTALKKALDVKSRLGNISSENTLIISADTIVEMDSVIYEKPLDKKDARRMLESMSGKSHAVHTAVTLIVNEKLFSFVEITKVSFSNISATLLDKYLDSGLNEYMDKSGAYGIQNLGALFVEKIEGCFYNVVGFPLNRFIHELSNSAYCMKSFLSSLLTSLLVFVLVKCCPSNYLLLNVRTADLNTQLQAVAAAYTMVQSLGLDYTIVLSCYDQFIFPYYDFNSNCIFSRFQADLQVTPLLQSTPVTTYIPSGETYLNKQFCWYNFAVPTNPNIVILPFSSSWTDLGNAIANDTPVLAGVPVTMTLPFNEDQLELNIRNVFKVKQEWKDIAQDLIAAIYGEADFLFLQPGLISNSCDRGNDIDPINCRVTFSNILSISQAKGWSTAFQEIGTDTVLSNSVYLAAYNKRYKDVTDLRQKRAIEWEEIGYPLSGNDRVAVEIAMGTIASSVIGEETSVYALNLKRYRNDPSSIAFI